MLGNTDHITIYEQPWSPARAQNSDSYSDIINFILSMTDKELDSMYKESSDSSKDGVSYRPARSASCP